ncbi:uncharacterized protein Bfra_004048 [Botrytis fragariae]|uniref:Uncharacterized protein n=1 Tax=Botrytis fragariae TaxID=1964551 RepID=A0A8H6AUT4_9HELO|nr:uncharacterized protein Bfra_004048 [Botrytis fragariae]KAF5874042.1 hypothetical protein Bfra_004048 [Botrytis fragariae]
MAIFKAAYDPNVVALSATDTDSIAFLNAGVDRIGSPNFEAGGFRATSIAPVLGELIQTYILLTQADKFGSTPIFLWQDSQGIVYTVTKWSGPVCYSYSSSFRDTPPSCRNFFTKHAFASDLSHISTAQPTNNGISSAVHYVGLYSAGDLLYAKQWSKSEGTSYFIQQKLGGTLIFAGEPLITRKSHTEFDIWAISNTQKSFHRSYTGTVDIGTWTEWEDLREYNSLAKPAVAYDAENNTYIMTLDPNNNNKYNFKLYDPQTS